MMIIISSSIMLQSEANTSDMWKTDSYFLFCTTLTNAS